MLRTRREALRDVATVLGGAALAALDAVRPMKMSAAADAQQPIPGWAVYVQPPIGVAFQHPPGWTPRVLESGMPSVAEGRDGFSGARAFAQLCTVKEGTGSGTLIYILATNLSLDLDGFRVVQAVKLSASPDLSALRYTVPYLGEVRKGTLTLEVKKGGATLLGFDAPAAVYGARLDALTGIAGTFRWFKSSLKLEQAFEPKEHAYSVMIPGGWRRDLRVIRPDIDAAFVIAIADPTGQISAEIHRPSSPGFSTPDPSIGLTEGSLYHIGDQWGMQPLLVYRYLPGKEYIRSFLLPQLAPARPRLKLVGWADRPDLALSPEVAEARRALGGGGAGGEAEYTWVRRDGMPMRGRAVALTVYTPNASGRGPGLWYAPYVMFADAPEAQFATAVAAMIVMNASFQFVPQWSRAELQGSRQRWRIILQTQKQLFNTYQETVQHRQDVAEQATEAWDRTIRYTFSGNSDYGSYVPYSDSSIMLPDGSIVPVIDLGGKSVESYMKEPNAYLKKAW